MGGSENEVVQLLWVGITIEVVGSILALLLWKLIVNVVEWCLPNPQPLLPLTAVGESAEHPLTTANAAEVEMETINAGGVVAEAVPTILCLVNGADTLPTCSRT